ncbi:unnamed protein product, partial [Mycena citricolor]
LHNEDSAVSDLTVPQPSHALLDTLLRHRKLLNHRLDVVARGKVEHTAMDRAGGNSRALDVDSTHDEGKTREGQVVLADRQRVDRALGLHHSHIRGPRGDEAGRHDQVVERPHILELRHAFRRVKLRRAQLRSLLPLRVGAREHDDLRAHLRREHDGQMAQPADPDDADALRGPDVVALDDLEHSRAATHQGSGVLRSEVGRDAEQERLLPDGVRAEGALVEAVRAVHLAVRAVLVPA